MVQLMSPSKLEPRNDLGRRLLALSRLKGHPNLRVASEASGINYQQLWDIVAKGKDPRVSTLERIVEAFGSTMAEFYALDPGPAGNRSSG